MDFDREINRRGSGCVKWDGMDHAYGESDMIPMWVADMDFEVAKPICDALKSRMEHAVYGYVEDNEDYRALFAQHFNTYENHDVKKEEVILSTGVVHSINACIQKLTHKQDKIMICSPAYPPFRRVVEENERILVDVPLCIRNDRYEMDFEAMERTSDGCVMFILCNPHNPTGRIFDEDELRRLATFCQKHKMLIISDEIHSDFAFEKAFIPIARISEYTKKHTITCVSCTKSFNLASLNVSALFIQEPALYNKMHTYLSLNGLSAINVFGLTAMQAAYENGQEWLTALVSYLKQNRDDAYAYIKENWSHVEVYKQEATYLMWLDMRYYGKDIFDRICNEARVLMNDGKTFGNAYEGFLRLNIACPKKQLFEALMRIEKIIK